MTDKQIAGKIHAKAAELDLLITQANRKGIHVVPKYGLSGILDGYGPNFRCKVYRIGRQRLEHIGHPVNPPFAVLLAKEVLRISGVPAKMIKNMYWPEDHA